MPWRLMEATQTGQQIKLFNGGDIHRDWTYIEDTVAGVLAALDKPLGYEIINLGCGAPISLTDFVELIEEYAGKIINTISVPTPLSDPPITYCDNSKARQLLGFAPTVPIREGLAAQLGVVRGLSRTVERRTFNTNRSLRQASLSRANAGIGYHKRHVSIPSRGTGRLRVAHTVTPDLRLINIGLGKALRPIRRNLLCDCRPAPQDRAGVAHSLRRATLAHDLHRNLIAVSGVAAPLHCAR